MKHKMGNLINRERILNIYTIQVFFFTVFATLFLRYVYFSYDYNGGRNLFYVQVINYSVPIIEKSNFDGEDLYENKFTFENLFENFSGLNLKTPSALITREIPYLNGNNSSTNGKNGLEKLISSFVISDDDIVKEKKINNDGSNPVASTVLNTFDERFKVKNPKEKPSVLIYHSHTAESYSPYGDNNRDKGKGVVAVGDQIVIELKKYGINAIDDSTINDENYLKSYTRSGEVLDSDLKKYGDFDLIIDLHRDSIDNKFSVTTNVNGASVARAMFVMTNKNPHYNKNIAVVNSLIAISNRTFNGFIKSTYEYERGTRFFNQDKSNNAVLLEVGSQVNTLSEAKNSGSCFARIIAEYLFNKG